MNKCGDEQGVLAINASRFSRTPALARPASEAKAAMMVNFIL